MNHFTTWMLFIFVSLIIESSEGIADLNKPSKHCVMERTHKMVGYNCVKLELKTIPSNLKSSAEVLDISQNRIRELTRDSFASLTDLRFLYIFDNMINTIDDDTFQKLVYLEALDLSGNALRDVPPEIFSLPLLRNLYIADNGFGDRGFDKVTELPKPIKAPLKMLSIANNRLNKIPDLGILPELYKLNLSSNYMHELKPQQFSPFCNIHEVDLNNTAMEKCRCEEVTRFLFRKRHAELSSSFYCDAVSSECKIDTNTSFAETKDYEICVKIRISVVEHKQAQITWGFIALGVVCFLVFFIGCLYCLHRRNVRQMNRKAKINNPNMKTVKMQKAKQLDPVEPVDADPVHNSPEKLLIKRSDV